MTTNGSLAAAGVPPLSGQHRDCDSLGPQTLMKMGSFAGSGPALLAFVLLLYAFNVYLNYPGEMNNDSIAQYAQAATGRFDDWHPPVMAWLWSHLRWAGDGPGPFLLLQLAVYWSGFGLCADALRRQGHPLLALMALLVGAFPPFVHLNTNLLKDVGLAASWLAAVGLLFWFRSQNRSIPLVFGLLLLALMAYGTLVRSNSVFALGPLVLYALAPASWLRSGRLIAAAVVVALLAIPVSQFVNSRIFDAAPRKPVHSLFMFDLLGIARHVGDPGLLAPRATLSKVDLKTCYTAYWWDSLSPWGRCASRVFRPDPLLAASGEGLALQWVNTILSHPLDYAIHRLKHFNSSILFVVPLRHTRLTPENRGDDPAFAPLEISTARDVKLDLIRKSPAVWPVTWLIWAAGLLVFLSQSEPTRSRNVAERSSLAAQTGRVLLVSALGYSFAYLVIGVATGLRYHYWSMTAILLASVLVLPHITQGFRDRSRTLIAAVVAVALATVIGLAARLLDFQAWVM